VAPAETRVYARNHSFEVGAQASLRDRDDHPSALEYLLGALAGDLLQGFEVEASRRQIAVHEGELNLQGRLDNVLVHLGVIGESGHPGLASITGTFYVSTDADAQLLEEIWQSALARSPLFHTLSKCAVLTFRLQAAP
jgi:hypothetical protein